MLIADRLRDPFAEARTFANRGRACETHAPATAIGWYDRALAVLSGGWSELVVDVVRWKGTAHRECGDTAEADRLYERSAEIAKELRYRKGLAHAANCRAIIAQRRGDSLTAERLFHEASDLARDAGDSGLRAMVKRNLGVVAPTRGWPGQALGHCGEGMVPRQEKTEEDGVSAHTN